jgi:hypothetical protein
MFVRNNFSYTNIDLTLQKRVETYIKRPSFGLVQKETFIETLNLKKKTSNFKIRFKRFRIYYTRTLRQGEVNRQVLRNLCGQSPEEM